MKAIDRPPAFCAMMIDPAEALQGWLAALCGCCAVQEKVKSILFHLQQETQQRTQQKVRSPRPPDAALPRQTEERRRASVAGRRAEKPISHHKLSYQV